MPDDIPAEPRKRTLSQGRPNDSKWTRFLLRFIGPPAVSPLSPDDVRALEEVRRRTSTAQPGQAQPRDETPSS
ncbi:hypothetical protein F8O06_03420 [Pseudoclavibacter sp. CFCC 14310]|uniref:hypothetical protein n=1 Tax=Pseudoclavibacter sp. CFCC 14310 TaxID=2615180 RepID=UPI00130188AF|nr:hypothetical protein [Pseudoclavibacter sp. CFCC 14310]KAB1647600.1 hypothetical protein F8O06_03420 [Pseudoclavibacter sp. CFCC 14310]